MSSQPPELAARLSVVFTQTDRLEGSQEGSNTSLDSRCFVRTNAQEMPSSWQKVDFQWLKLHPKSKEGQGIKGFWLPLFGYLLTVALSQAGFLLSHSRLLFISSTCTDDSVHTSLALIRSEVWSAAALKEETLHVFSGVEKAVESLSIERRAGESSLGQR